MGQCKSLPTPAFLSLLSNYACYSFGGRTQPQPEQTGEGKYGEFDYHWMATLTHEGQPSRVVQEDSVEELRYTLWRVQLTIQKDDLVRRYHFNELAW